MSDTVSPTTKAGKRKASDSESATTSGESSLRCESCGSSPPGGAESESSLSSSVPLSSSQEDIKECTSRWTLKTLEKLRVKSELREIFTPAELIERMTCDFNLLLKVTDPRMEDRIEKCKNRILSSSPFRYLDVHDIYQLDTKQAFALMFECRDKVRHMRINEWDISQGPPFLDPVEEHFYKRFHVTGEDFSRQLMYMTMCSKKDQHISQAMYQTLFQHFSGLLGFVSFFQPSFEGEKLAIQNVEVTSVPDLAFPYFGQTEESMELMAICEVKDHFGRDSESDTSPRKTGNKRRKLEVVKHLDDDLMGQHGGDLLLHLPLSSKQYRSGLLGFIVQKTFVTFTYLTCSKKQFDGILSGKMPSTDSPVIQYSRPYNYLRAEDRAEILEPFIRLGFMQRTPCKC